MHVTVEWGFPSQGDEPLLTGQETVMQGRIKKKTDHWRLSTTNRSILIECPVNVLGYYILVHEIASIHFEDACSML